MAASKQSLDLEPITVSNVFVLMMGRRDYFDSNLTRSIQILSA